MQNVNTYKKDTVLNAFLSPQFALALCSMGLFWVTIGSFDATDTSNNAGNDKSSVVANAGPEIMDTINGLRPLQLANSGKLEDATKAATELLAKKGHDPIANTCAGNVFILAGANDDGLKYLRKGVALSHRNKYIILNYAQHLAKLNHSEEAVTQFQALEKTDPTWDVPHMELAKLYIANKQPELAADELGQLVQSDDKNFAARKLRGIALARSGKTAQGLDEYVLAAEQEAHSGPPDALKQLLGTQGNTAVDRVAYELNQQVNNRPDDYVPKLRLAQLDIYTGNAADAKELLMDARRLAPNNPEVHRTLAVVQKQLGEDNQALSAFALSVKLEQQQENRGK